MHPSIRPGAVAVVTGAAAGIGAAIATRLAFHNMVLILCDKDETALVHAAAGLRARYPSAAIHLVAGDISNAAVQKELFNEATRRGEIGLLVNNAGVTDSAGPWQDSLRWRALMEVNFWSVLQLQELFVPHFLTQTSPAAIVNVGSKEGITTAPGNAAYAMSKAAQRVLTEQLAHELREASGERITAHLLLPGYTFTSMNFPGAQTITPRPAAPWSADQVVQRMVERMEGGHFYLFCEDNEVTRELDQRRMQWSADDLIQDRPALSRWHPAWRAQFAAYVADVSPLAQGKPAT
jgi:NAD(P)-dependent dehydrogenase (short-subunit alcohol dehydrogenase family)